MTRLIIRAGEERRGHTGFWKGFQILFYNRVYKVIFILNKIYTRINIFEQKLFIISNFMPT